MPTALMRIFSMLETSWAMCTLVTSRSVAFDGSQSHRTIRVAVEGLGDLAPETTCASDYDVRRIATPRDDLSIRERSRWTDLARREQPRPGLCDHAPS